MVQRAIILLLLPVWLHAQHLAPNRYVVAPGEYNTFMVDNTTHRLYQIADYPHSFLAAGLPDSFSTCAGGAHWSIALTLGGRVYTWGDSSISTPTPALVATDSSGVAFNHVIKVGSGGTAGNEPWNFYAVKDDGTVWVWKYTNIGVRGNGTAGSYSSLPVKVPFPAGTVIKDAFVEFCGVALDSAGNVWTWGANPGTTSFYAPYLLGQNCGACAQPYNYANTPTKITLPARCTMICGGSALMNYFLLANGQLYATAWNISYIGLQKYSGHQDMSYNNFLPIRVDTALNLQAPIDTIMQTSLGTYVILTDSTLWFWGSNACGNSGMGPGLDMRHYSGSSGWAPFNFDQGQNQAMTGNGLNGAGLPIQCMPGIKITKIFGSTAVDFYTYVENSHDSLFGTGRNKGAVMGNRIGEVDSLAGNLGSSYPNYLDVNYWTYYPIDTSNKFVIRMTACPLFIDTTGALYQSTYPVNTSGSAPAPSVTISKTAGHYTLNGVPGWSTPATGEFHVIWTRDSGPGAFPLPMQANDVVAFYNPSVGDHLMRYTVEDNNCKTTAVTIHVNIGWARKRIGNHRFR